VVTLIAAYAIKSLAWTPLRCSVLEKNSRLTLDAITPIADTLKAYRIARATYESLVQAYRDCPTEVGIPMLAADYAAFLHDRDATILWDQRALTVNRRPEIYMNLGVAQREAGDHRAALQNMATALRFDVGYADELGDPAMVAGATREAAEQTRALARERGRAPLGK
jgi:hypothetical protein